MLLWQLLEVWLRLSISPYVIWITTLVSLLGKNSLSDSLISSLSSIDFTLQWNSDQCMISIHTVLIFLEMNLY